MIYRKKFFFGLIMGIICFLLLVSWQNFVLAFTEVDPGTVQNPVFSPTEGTVRLEAVQGPQGPPGDQGPRGQKGSQGDKGDTGPAGDEISASCDWDGQVWVSYGENGELAFEIGSWLNCSGGQLIDVTWEQ